MRIDHIAIWTENIDLLREFYIKYFKARSGEKYINTAKKFTSYFLSFNEGQARIELMHNPDVKGNDRRVSLKGLAHFAISVGEKKVVNELTERLRSDGYIVVGEPRTTGDGYYESVVLDPEGNILEIVV